MNEQPVDVEMKVDSHGNVTVTAAEQVWVPSGPGRTTPGVRLERTDVPWILDQLLSEHGGPLRVVLHDGGHVFTDVVTHDRLEALTPPPTPRPEASAEPEPSLEPPRPGSPGRPSSGWFSASGYTPGEEVAVAVVVTQLSADEHGAIGFTLPAALRAMVGDVIAIGKESREIYLNQADYEPPSTTAVDRLAGLC